MLVLSILVGIVGLVTLIAQVVVEGAGWLSFGFITNFPSRFPERAGVWAALWGTVWIMGITFLFAVPVGVGAAVYLEEYAPKNRLTRLIELNIANLAGVPSIVYGLLGLAVFISLLGLGRTLLTGGMTMGLLVMPIVIISSREAIRAVPSTYREAAYGLGATRFQVVIGVVLPQAVPGIMTGTILAMSRAIGEAAPMIAIAALTFVTFAPTGPMDRFTVLPIQIYSWVQDPREGFSGLAAAGIIVLLVVLLSMNAIAILIRNKTQTRSEE
ncbi:MAG: phosphate ABC transporter permease PstA [Chloroflexi bacterium]|nr:phosphate ABC transporter permease PstA [Chloroflexota bacterium]